MTCIAPRVSYWSTALPSGSRSGNFAAAFSALISPPFARRHGRPQGGARRGRGHGEPLADHPGYRLRPLGGANFPGVRVECGPVADYLDALPDADVMLGGPPCQPFSDAGENEGEADDRDCIPDFCAAVERASPRGSSSWRTCAGC
jgi:hypothetical protein